MTGAVQPLPIPRGVYAIADALHLFWILGADVLLLGTFATNSSVPPLFGDNLIYVANKPVPTPLAPRTPEQPRIGRAY